jgi:hypothetical protein
MTEPTPTPSPTPTPPPAAPPPTSWHTGVDAEVLGFWQNKGLPLDDPKTFGVKLTELYRGAEKFIGAPPDQLIRMPKPDAKPEEISAFRQRLGVPAEAKDYDFTSIKDAAGQPLAQPLADALRAASHEAGVPKDAAAKVAAAVVKHLDSVQTTQSNLLAGNLTEERAKLEKNWGGKESPPTASTCCRRRKARRLGLDEQAVATLENLMGYSKVMDAFRKVGNARREDVFSSNRPGQHGGAGKPTTMEGAMARKSELMADKAWAARFTSGDAEARREYDQLNHMIEWGGRGMSDHRKTNEIEGARQRSSQEARGKKPRRALREPAPVGRQHAMPV